AAARARSDPRLGGHRRQSLHRSHHTAGRVVPQSHLASGAGLARAGDARGAAVSRLRTSGARAPHVRAGSCNLVSKSRSRVTRMADRLKDKVAIVFGAGSAGPGWGNGKAAAVAFAREGAKVICVDLVAEAAEETAAIITGEGNVGE